jgi:hypothetical protein
MKSYADGQVKTREIPNIWKEEVTAHCRRTDPKNPITELFVVREASMDRREK